MEVSQDGLYYTFTFQKDDWNTNLAKTMMDTIKSLPNRERAYMPITKQWKVAVNDSNKQIINDAYRRWEKVQPTDMQLNLYDDVVEDFMKQFD